MSIAQFFYTNFQAGQNGSMQASETTKVLKEKLDSARKMSAEQSGLQQADEVKLANTACPFRQTYKTGWDLRKYANQQISAPI